MEMEESEKGMEDGTVECQMCCIAVRRTHPEYARIVNAERNKEFWPKFRKVDNQFIWMYAFHTGTRKFQHQSVGVNTKTIINLCIIILPVSQSANDIAEFYLMNIFVLVYLWNKICL